jgi:hypothetical protein
MSRVQDKARNMVGSIGALQTLVEKFPMQLVSFDNINYSCSFDLLWILFKTLGIEKDKVLETVTDALTENINGDLGFINDVEETIKYVIEANLVNILNCTTDPIIANELLYKYEYKYDSTGEKYERMGTGIDINVSEIDMSGTLSHNPCSEIGKNYFFDVDYTPSDIYQSTDFNAFLWWVINKGDGSRVEESTWDNRCLIKDGDRNIKDIITCVYIDKCYPQNDVIRVYLSPETYYNTRKIPVGNKDGYVNKTIFEFNHDFLHSIKLFDPKVIIAEMISQVFGETGRVCLDISITDRVVKEKVDQIIQRVINESDTEINDCFFSFSNEQYNEMVEKAEQKRFNVVNTGNGYVQINPSDALNKLTGITADASLEENKTVIKEILNDLTVTPAKDPEVEISFDINYDWKAEIIRMLVYPLVRPIFSPKVLFLLVLNKKIMGSITSIEDVEKQFEQLLTGLWNIVKDVIVKIKNMVVDLFLKLVINELKPLLELFASRLLAETLKTYKDLLTQLLEECLIGWDNNNNGIVGNIDNVNYADIIPTQVIPEQSIC